MAALFTACSSSSSSDNLDGQLSVELLGPADVGFSISISTWDGDEFEGEAFTDVIPESGVFSAEIDPGDYEGVEVAASIFGEENPDAVLRLLSDGDLVAETDTPTDDDFFLLVVGDFPDFDF